MLCIANYRKKIGKKNKECILEEWLEKGWEMHTVSQEKIPEIPDTTLKTLAADRVLPIRE